jgi:conjugal transfer/entry exclusion protein
VKWKDILQNAAQRIKYHLANIKELPLTIIHRVKECIDKLFANGQGVKYTLLSRG